MEPLMFAFLAQLPYDADLVETALDSGMQAIEVHAHHPDYDINHAIGSFRDVEVRLCETRDIVPLGLVGEVDLADGLMVMLPLDIEVCGIRFDWEGPLRVQGSQYESPFALRASTRRAGVRIRPNGLGHRELTRWRVDRGRVVGVEGPTLHVSVVRTEVRPEDPDAPAELPEDEVPEVGAPDAPPPPDGDSVPVILN